MSSTTATTTATTPIIGSDKPQLTISGRSKTKNSPFASSQAPSSPNEPGRFASETLLAGPFEFFDKSMSLEFLHPDPSRDASMLMRITYRASHKLTALGRDYPQSPPLHIHFSQFENFCVVSGSVGVSRGWGADYRHYIVRPEDGNGGIPAREPHSVWPDPDNRTEDGVVLIWAGPDDVTDGLDHVFFYNLLCVFSDAYEAGVKPGLLQAALTQYETGTAMVWLPAWRVLGPLRWAVPWFFEGILARVAKLAGYKPFLEKYITNEEIDMFRTTAVSKKRV